MKSWNTVIPILTYNIYYVYSKVKTRKFPIKDHTVTAPVIMRLQFDQFADEVNYCEVS
jgi:hypothetical protein